MENFFEEAKCPVCNSQDFIIKYSFNYYSQKVIEILRYSEIVPDVKLRKCKNCGHYYASPQVSDFFLEEYYSKCTSEYYSKDKEPIDDLREEHLKIYNIITKYLKGGNVLEIGCGYGFLLNTFKNDTWKVYGIEPSKHASLYAKSNLKLNVTNDFLTLNTFPPNYFDAIIFFDVIEHIKETKSFFNTIKHYLKPNGLIFFGTGNIESWNAKLSGKNWGYFSSWEHISFYSTRSIKYLLDINGFDLKKIYKVSYSGSIIKNLGVLIKNNTIYRFKNTLKTLINSVYNKHKYEHIKYNLSFDHMVVIGKIKKSDSEKRVI